MLKNKWESSQHFHNVDAQRWPNGGVLSGSLLSGRALSQLLHFYNHFMLNSHADRISWVLILNPEQILIKWTICDKIIEKGRIYTFPTLTNDLIVTFEKLFCHM